MKEHLNLLAEELAESFVNGNITGVFVDIKTFSPIDAAYLVLKINHYLPNGSRYSFERALERQL